MNENSCITGIQVSRPAPGWSYYSWVIDDGYHFLWMDRERIIGNCVTIVPISAIGRVTPFDMRKVPITKGSMMQAIVNHVFCYVEAHGLWDEVPEPAPNRTSWVHTMPGTEKLNRLCKMRNAKLMYEVAKYLTNVLVEIEGYVGPRFETEVTVARVQAGKALMMVDGDYPFDPDLDAQLLLFSINETARDKIKVFEGMLNESAETNPRKRISFFESEFFGGNLPERIS